MFKNLPIIMSYHRIIRPAKKIAPHYNSQIKLSTEEDKLHPLSTSRYARVIVKLYKSSSPCICAKTPRSENVAQRNRQKQLHSSRAKMATSLRKSYAQQLHTASEKTRNEEGRHPHAPWYDCSAARAMARSDKASGEEEKEDPGARYRLDGGRQLGPPGFQPPELVLFPREREIPIQAAQLPSAANGSTRRAPGTTSASRGVGFALISPRRPAVGTIPSIYSGRLTFLCGMMAGELLIVLFAFSIFTRRSAAGLAFSSCRARFWPVLCLQIVYGIWQLLIGLNDSDKYLIGRWQKIRTENSS